ncbi:phosphatases II [Fomitopsis schrenkii]|uniref:protein-tyrosine-phosphatase n=1 Tax=Fomitopsis schrenkii TaxID=2126942 RepID=S8EHD7_FOMSC|nr:phosphatases II [Fomitopsis schrenkii]
MALAITTVTPLAIDLSEMPPLMDIEEAKSQAILSDRTTTQVRTPSPPRAPCITSMVRSLTVDDDYFERRVLRATCIQKNPVDDFHPQYSEIVPGLFLADMYTATSAAVIRDLGITHVVSVVKRGCPHYLQDLKHICVPIEDTRHAEILNHLDATTEWIRRALAEGGQVMVHCVWGMSRSASFVIAFLMADRGMSLDDALKYVVARRKIVRPNSGFMVQLSFYEHALRRRRERRTSVESILASMSRGRAWKNVK